VESAGRIAKEIFLTRRRLNEINSIKEELYKRKQLLRDEIIQTREELKKLREERENYTKKIDSLMDERAKTLEQLNKIREELKVLREKKRYILKSKKLDVDINKLRKELETLEYVLQTEILSYTQERKIWNRIKYLRKLLGKYEELAVVMQDLEQKQVEYGAYKSKLAIIRENIRKNIELRKQVKERIKELRELLTKLREEYDQVKDEIIKYKQEFKDLNDKMKELLEKYVTMVKKKEEALEVSEKDIQEVLERYQKVQEKIMNGETIGTEDILVMQKYEILKNKGLIKS